MGLLCDVNAVEPLRDDEVSWFVLLVYSYKLAFQSHLITILGLAYIHSAEVSYEIIIAHPESTIILIELRLNDLSDVRCPESTLSAPCSIPFKTTP